MDNGIKCTILFPISSVFSAKVYVQQGGATSKSTSLKGGLRLVLFD